MARPRLRRLLIAGVALVVLAAGSVLALHRPELLVYHRPVVYGEGFHEAIRNADRVVVRAGGFDCCGSTEDDGVYFEITDLEAVKQVTSHVVFKGGSTTNSFDESCMCCGHPGIDWYRGGRRLAVTALQHGDALRWRGFSTARVLGVTVGYGDAQLTEESGEWLVEWLRQRTGMDFS